MKKLNKSLLLIWKDPVTRRNFTIGQLCLNTNFTFRYCGDFAEAEKFGWVKLNAFPEEKTYASENMFPIFSSRLPDRKRRDIHKILEKYPDTYYAFRTTQLINNKKTAWTIKGKKILNTEKDKMV